jgi:spore maturation protein CgeB
MDLKEILDSMECQVTKEMLEILFPDFRENLVSRDSEDLAETWAIEAGREMLELTDCSEPL